MKPVISLHNVTKNYGPLRGVRDVTLVVRPGTVFGFLGPNGAGKTTTISMLVNLIQPTSGTIRLFGLDARTEGQAARQRIGFVAGDMALDSGLTGWQQLEFFARLRGDFDQAYVRELAARLAADLGRKIKTLSRGNRQKIALISALMHRPELLILDEPTSGLDPLVQAEFNAIIAEHKQAGNTVFMSSHVLSEVQQLCDRVAFIREGEIIADQPIEAIAAGLPQQIRLVTPDAKLAKELAAFKGVAGLRQEGQAVSCTFSGDIHTLLALLSKREFSDLSITPAELETIFMNYYREQ